MATAIETTLFALLLYPDAQRHAQREIDRVLGQKRLPDFGDRETIPYIDHIIQESLRYLECVSVVHIHSSYYSYHSRWHPPAPLGLSCNCAEFHTDIRIVHRYSSSSDGGRCLPGPENSEGIRRYCKYQVHSLSILLSFIHTELDFKMYDHGPEHLSSSRGFLSGTVYSYSEWLW